MKAWNKGKRVGQKVFNLAIDSKLRSSDLIQLKVHDICSGSSIRPWAIIDQKTSRSSI